MDSSYLITGGAGFIGSNLAKRLIEAGHRVIIFDDLSTGFRHNVPSQAEFHQLDISNRDELARIRYTGTIGAAFHLAAQSSGEVSFADPGRDMDVNFRGTYHVLQWASSHGSPHFLYASSMSVYGDQVDNFEGGVLETVPCQPVSYYGLHKLASEQLIRIYSAKHGMRYTTLRLFNVYGPGQNMSNRMQGMLSIYLSYITNNQPIHVKGSLDRFRDFVYIDDVIEIFQRCMGNAKAMDQIINVGTGRKVTVREALTAILAIYGKTEFETWVRQEGTTPGDILGITASTTKLKACTDIDRLTSFEDGLRKMKNWLDAATNQ